MVPPDLEVLYSLKALHTTQYYRLQGGVLYYRTAKSDLEYAFPLNAVKSQGWRRYFDQYFWWGLLITIFGLIYFAQIAERGALRYDLRHAPFALAVLVGACQAIYWARFPRTYRLVSTSGDALSIFVDGKNPAPGMEFIEAVRKGVQEGKLLGQQPPT